MKSLARMLAIFFLFCTCRSGYAMDYIKRLYSFGEHNSLQKSVVYDEEYKAELEQVMYEKLDPMPKDLIRIISGYLPFAPLQGECIYSLKGVFRDPIVLSNGRIAVVEGYLSFGKQNNICLIDASTGTIIQRMSPASSDDYFQGIVFELDENTVVVFARSRSDREAGKILFYNCATGECIRAISVHRVYDKFIKLAQAVFAALYGCYHGYNNEFKELDIWDAASGKIMSTLKTSDKICTVAVLSSEQKSLAMSTRTGCELINGEGRISVYNWETGQRLKTFGTVVYPILVALTSHLLLSKHSMSSEGCCHRSRSDVLNIWDCSTGELLKTIESNHNMSYEAIVKLPSQQVVVIASDGAVSIIDPRTGACKKEFKTKNDCFCYTVVGVLPHSRIFLNGVDNIQIFR